MIERDLQRMAQACEAEGATEVRIAESPEAADEVLEARRAALPALSRLEPLTILEDATVPRSRIAEMVECIQEVAAAPRAQDRHVRPRGRRQPASDRGPRRRGRGRGATAPTPPSMRSSPRAIELGGTITGEHGVGSVKLRYLERQLGADHMALLRRIKAAFDPNGILNPGKLGS